MLAVDSTHLAPSTYLSSVVEVPRERRAHETEDLFAAVLESTDPDECEDLYERIVMVNACVARGVAHRFEGRGIPADDLEQVGYLALVVAARRFDPTRGHDFLQYAVPTISGELKRWFRDHGWTVRVPRLIQEVQTLIKRAEVDALEHVTHSEVEGLATRLGLPVHRIEEALRARGCFQPASLDLPVGEGGSGLLGELIPEDRDDRPAAEARAMLRPLLAELPPRQREIVRLRYDEDLTQQAISDRLDLTQAQVSRLLSQIHDRLRRALTTSGEPARRAS